MRIEFNILWVEDQKGAVKSQKERIALLLRKQGFKLQTEFVASVKEASDRLSSDIFGDHIDLVLMDYNLGTGPSGAKGIAAVRDVFPYKDIIFYSANSVKKLQAEVTKGKFGGVFCSSRNDLPDTVYGVFETLVKKVLDIDHSRGIVMGATSEIDHFVIQALEKVFEQGDAALRLKVLSIVGEQLKDIRKSFEKGFESVAAAQTISKLAKNHLVYSAAKKLALLRKVLALRSTHRDECEKIKLYENNVVPKRNKMAHVTVERNGFSRKIISDGVEITTEYMQELRVALLDSHELFEAVLASI